VSLRVSLLDALKVTKSKSTALDTEDAFDRYLYQECKNMAASLMIKTLFQTIVLFQIASSSGLV